MQNAFLVFIPCHYQSSYILDNQILLKKKKKKRIWESFLEQQNYVTLANLQPLWIHN